MFKHIIIALGYAVCRAGKVASSDKELAYLNLFRDRICLSGSDLEYTTYRSEDDLLTLARGLDPFSKIIAWRLMLSIAYLENEDDPLNLEGDVSESERLVIDKFVDSMFNDIGIKPLLSNVLRNKSRDIYSDIVHERTLNYEDLVAFEDSYFAFLENTPEVWLSQFEKLRNAAIYWSEININFIDLSKSLEIQYGKIKRKLDLLLEQKERRDENEIKSFRKASEESSINILHEFSSAHGIQYCKYCGVNPDYNYRDCSRSNGHKYSIKKVNGKFQPICSRCGSDSERSYRDC